MCEDNSWYGGLGATMQPRSQLQKDLQRISVATGQLPGVGNPHNGGQYMTWCGNATSDHMQGTRSLTSAERYARFSHPHLKYKKTSGSVFISDAEKARNFNHSPAPGSPLATVYESCGENMFKQEHVGSMRYMPSEYVYACPGQQLTLTEAQMVNAPIDHSYGYHPHQETDFNVGGGNYTVNRMTREVEHKPYHMGPSMGYPTREDAQWAAENLVVPRQMLATKYL